MGRLGRLRRIVVWACVASAVLAVAASAASPGARTSPVPLRKVVSIAGSDGWKVRVNGSVADATKRVLAENMFNDPPRAGRQFLLVNVTATFTGKGKETPFGGLTFKALGRSNVAYDYRDRCGVVPDELEPYKDVFTGGSVTGNVCFSVRKGDVAGLLLLVQPALSLDDVDVFFRIR